MLFLYRGWSQRGEVVLPASLGGVVLGRGCVLVGILLRSKGRTATRHEAAPPTTTWRRIAESGGLLEFAEASLASAAAQGDRGGGGSGGGGGGGGSTDAGATTGGPTGRWGGGCGRLGNEVLGRRLAEQKDDTRTRHGQAFYTTPRLIAVHAHSNSVGDLFGAFPLTHNSCTF